MDHEKIKDRKLSVKMKHKLQLVYHSPEMVHTLRNWAGLRRREMIHYVDGRLVPTQKGIDYLRKNFLI